MLCAGEKKGQTAPSLSSGFFARGPKIGLGRGTRVLYNLYGYYLDYIQESHAVEKFQVSRARILPLADGFIPGVERRFGVTKRGFTEFIAARFRCPARFRYCAPGCFRAGAAAIHR
jgi:hypothetical protein